MGSWGQNCSWLIDHEQQYQTTTIAGTTLYLAPECFNKCKASKESDVHSYGIVALEITYGRRPVDSKAEESKVILVEWVWELYRQGRILEAVDEKLGKKFDFKQIEHLMIVGLRCAHPDYKLRPTMRQAIKVLNFDAP
ncbi:Protein kinase domain [Dillenia turbinata]|uniref:Protein kinase domain n=1 Tax=Dillenia turbinata TaxID=194707 RepID=A0AAN8V4K2_9MAGN